MTIEWWFAYLLTSIILSLSPGSGAINTMSTSINHGYRGAAASIAGLQTGLAIHIVLVGVGLGTLFSRSVLAFEVLKWAGSRLPDLAGYPAMAGGRGDRPEYAGEGADARQTVSARGVRKSHQSQKHCFSGRPVSAVYPAAPAAGDAIYRSGRHHHRRRYHCDDWLCDPGAAHFRMDQRAKADEGVEQSLWFTVYAGRGAARLRPPCLNHGISLAKRGSPGERRFLSARAGAQSG